MLNTNWNNKHLHNYKEFILHFKFNNLAFIKQSLNHQSPSDIQILQTRLTITRLN